MADDRLTDVELAKIEARWSAGQIDGSPKWQAFVNRSDSDFTKAARSDIPRLLSEVRALQEDVAVSNRSALRTVGAVKSLARIIALKDALRIVEMSSSWIEQTKKIHELIDKEA